MERTRYLFRFHRNILYIEARLNVTVQSEMTWSVVFFLTVDKDGRVPCITDRNCHKQATCKDFKCYCKKGYEGNGHKCIGKIWTFLS